MSKESGPSPEESDWEKRLVLFKFRDVYFVVETKYFPKDGDVDYLYHSHHCFGNLIQGARYTYSMEFGSDPHGLLRYVSSVMDTKDNRYELDHRIGTVSELFEFFKTDGKPAPSQWPEDNHGALPFIADMQNGHRAERLMLLEKVAEEAQKMYDRDLKPSPGLAAATRALQRFERGE